MTKRAQIEALYVQGKRRAEIIALLPDFSPGYIGNVIGDIRNPGASKRSHKKWRATDRGRLCGGQQQTRWRQKHQDQVANLAKRALEKKQEATRSSARNHGQRWTQHELEYLRENGQEMSAQQLALALGRSYAAVNSKAHKEDIDLRGDKVGAGAQRFVGTVCRQIESYPAIA